MVALMVVVGLGEVVGLTLGVAEGVGEVLGVGDAVGLILSTGLVVGEALGVTLGVGVRVGVTTTAAAEAFLEWKKRNVPSSKIAVIPIRAGRNRRIYTKGIK